VTEIGEPEPIPPEETAEAIESDLNEELNEAVSEPDAITEQPASKSGDL
jgi:hypothetical protein